MKCSQIYSDPCGCVETALHCTDCCLLVDWSFIAQPASKHVDSAHSKIVNRAHKSKMLRVQCSVQRIYVLLPR